ncbi:uncharacterized protein N7469_006182 [Penicillium citrinum]|uniref:Uncharacterized protein n=2 Tax=Penicillium TaxID=5073 RepID=A0A9W9TNV4_PENCI|nr:uncharacterized protein N7469_006182 [Penicillium citrinum]KAJ5231594.1 hypothetical protein N7469_006182 [Penicillium citrinum]KAJ5579127.1 hypothetical protein N7450_007994 [Penicillium hetheringtonii]
MVEGSHNLELNTMAEIFLQSSRFKNSESVASSAASTSASNSEGLRYSIQSSLWRNAQAQLRKIKHPKKGVSFFDNGEPETFKTKADVELNMLLESETDADHELLDCDSYLTINPSTYDFPEADHWPFDWMDEDSGEEHSDQSVFECISVSDPTTSMESLFSSYSTASSYSAGISDMLICEEDVESFSLKDGSDLLCEF